MNSTPDNKAPAQPAEGTTPPAPPDTPTADALTPDEQMERFEDALKETDWGHQPC